MIDPLETALLHLSNDADLMTAIGGRIAAKSKYAMDGASVNGWTVGARSLSADLLPAAGDLYTGTLPFRLAVRCWGGDQQEAMAVWQEVNRVVEQTERTIVTLSGGDNALLYFLTTETTPEMAFDPDIKMDFVYVVVRGSVHRDPVP